MTHEQARYLAAFNSGFITLRELAALFCPLPWSMIPEMLDA